MNSKHFIFALILSLSSLVSAGDLSYSKCPASFDLSTANSTNDDSILLSKRGTSLFGGYMNTQSTDRVESIVIKSNATDLTSYLLVLSIPFILYEILFLAGFLTMIACCLFDKSCPPCDSWRRDYSKQPYKKSELRVVAIFSIIFCIGVCVTTIIAFTALPEMKVSMDNTKCGLYLTLDATKNGDSSTGWAGIDKLAVQLNSIISNLNSTATAVGNSFTSNDWIINDLSNQQLKNIELYKSYANNTLSSPDPNTTSDINSVFIATGLGPNGTANTMVSDIDSSLQITKKLSTVAYAVDQSAKTLVATKDLVQNNIVLSISNMNMASTQLSSFQTELDSFSTQQFDKNFSYLLYTVEGVLGFTLVASLLGLLGVFATHIFDIYNCRMMVHLSWILFGVSYLGVILLTYLFVPGGSIGQQTCNYFGKALTNQTEFERLQGYYSQNVLGKVEECLFGDGNILKTFNAYSEMYAVTNLFSNIDSYNDMITPTNKNYVDLSIAYNKINTWATKMQKYRDGILSDSNSYETNDRNPQYSLKSLNDYTLWAVNGQNCTQDSWVFDNTNCTSAYLVYSPGVTTTTGTTLTTSPLCISFNEAIAQGREKWTQTDFGTRYVQIATKCNASYPIIINYGNALIRYRDSRIKLFQAITDDLASLLSNNNDYNQNLVTFKNKVSSFSTSVATLKDLVSSKLTGLSISSNCSVIASDLFFVKNSLCTNFMGQAVKIGLCVSLLCVLMIGAIITGYVFALRYSRIEKELHISPELEESQVDSEASIDSNE